MGLWEDLSISQGRLGCYFYDFRRASQVVSPSDLPDSPGETSPVSKRKNKPAAEQSATKQTSKSQQVRTESLTPPLPHPDSQPSNQNVGQQQRDNQDQYHQQTTGQVHQHNMGGNNEAISNLLGLSGQFGSLSGLASLQGPEIIEHDDSTLMYPQPHIPQHYAGGPPMMGTPTNYYHYHQQQYHMQYNLHNQSSTYSPGYNMPSNIASVTPIMQQQHPVGMQHQTTPSTPYSHQGQQFRHATPQSAIVRPMGSVTPQQMQHNNSMSTPVHPAGILRPPSQTSVGNNGPQASTTNTSNTGAKLENAMSKSQDSINKPQTHTANANTKVDQFLSDTVRTYAVEGTPGPNSSRSSLSALSFLDDADVASPGLQLLKSSLTKSRETVLSASKSAHALLESQKKDMKKEVKTPETSPGKPLGKFASFTRWSMFLEPCFVWLVKPPTERNIDV